MRRAYVALVVAMVSWGVAVTITDAALATLSAADVLIAEVTAGTAVVGALVLGRASYRWAKNIKPAAYVLPTASWSTASVLGESFDAADK